MQSKIFLAFVLILLVFMGIKASYPSGKLPVQQHRAKRLFFIYLLVLILFYGQLFVAGTELYLYQRIFYGWGIPLAVGVTTVRYLFVWSVVHSSPISSVKVRSVLIPFIPSILNLFIALIRYFFNDESLAPISADHFWGHAILYMTMVPPWASAILLFAPLIYILIIQQRMILRYFKYGKSDVYYYTKRLYLIGIHAFSLLTIFLGLLMIIQVGVHYQFWPGFLPLSINEGFLPAGIKLLPLLHLAVVLLLFSTPKLVQFEPINPEETRARLRKFFSAYPKAVEGDHHAPDDDTEHPLVTQIREAQLFLINDLRVDDLADKLEKPASELRRLFVSDVGLNFNQLINGLRVEYLLSLIDEGELERYTLEALGKKAGFNSRATMYRAIKRFAPEYVYQM